MLRAICVSLQSNLSVYLLKASNFVYTTLPACSLFLGKLDQMSLSSCLFTSHVSHFAIKLTVAHLRQGGCRNGQNAVKSISLEGCHLILHMAKNSCICVDGSLGTRPFHETITQDNREVRKRLMHVNVKHLLFKEAKQSIDDLPVCVVKCILTSSSS